MSNNTLPPRIGIFPILARFPFTYQTGFQGGQKQTFFRVVFSHRFLGLFGPLFGAIFGAKIGPKIYTKIDAEIDAEKRAPF